MLRGVTIKIKQHKSAMCPLHCYHGNDLDPHHIYSNAECMSRSVDHFFSGAYSPLDMDVRNRRKFLRLVFFIIPQITVVATKCTCSFSCPRRLLFLILIRREQRFCSVISV